MDYSKEEKSEYLKNKVKELTDSVTDELKEVYSGDKYRNWVEVATKFPHYSLNNQMLIMIQKPEATNVCSFTNWKKLGRAINAGAKGINILAPNPYKKWVEIDKLDGDGKPILDENGKNVKEKVLKEFMSFKPVKVFDLSDTNGKPLPQLTKNLTGSVNDFEVLWRTLEKISPVPVEKAKIETSANGYFNFAEQKIVVDSELSEKQMIKTLAHEVAHALIHDRNNGARVEGVATPDEKTRSVKEIEAETTAYIFCKNLGIDTSDYSLNYVAGWENDPEMKAFRKSLDDINKVASHMIKDAEKYLPIVKEEIAVERYPDMSVMFVACECAEYPTFGNQYTFDNFDKALEKYKEMPNGTSVKGLVMDVILTPDDMGESYHLVCGSRNQEARTYISDIAYHPIVADALNKIDAEYPVQPTVKELSTNEFFEIAKEFGFQQTIGNYSCYTAEEKIEFLENVKRDVIESNRAQSIVESVASYVSNNVEILSTATENRQVSRSR